MKKNVACILEKTFGLAELEDLATSLLPLAKNARVVALYGPLGAGKTTLVRALTRALGIRKPVTSPSFTYLTQYTDAQNTPVYHFDFYRLSSPNYFYEAGFDELIGDQQAMVFIEWPEIVAHLLPPNTLHVHLSYAKESAQRIIRVEHK